MGCAARAASEFSFSMLERDIDEDDFCDDALVAIMLRDPVASAKSTMQANHFDTEKVKEVLTSGVVKPLPHDGCLPEWDTYQHFDNFVTRSLGGGYSAAPGKVTRAHLELAKKRLQKMQVVLILEELQQHLPQLNVALQWEL